MIKKLVATATLAAGLALLAPSAASAADVGQTRTLYPGQTSCISAWANFTARGDVYVTSGHAVRVTLGTPTRVVVDSVTPVFAAGYEINEWSNPAAFPGEIKLCAINQSQKLSTVSMRLVTQ